MAVGAETEVIDMEPVMHVQLASLAQASVIQIRDAIRRATAVRPPSECSAVEAEFLAGVEVSDSTWGDWQDTLFDVRRTPTM